MLKVLEHIESMGLRVAPEILVIPGVVFLVIGLCIWLGGLRWSKLSAGFWGLMVGCLVGVHVTDYQLTPVIGLGVLGAGFAAFFDKPALVLIGSIVVAVVCVLMFSWPMIEGYDWAVPAVESAEKGAMGIGESLSAVNDLSGYLCKNVAVAVGKISAAGMVISVGAAVVFAVVGFWLRRLMVAMSCSMLGSFAVFGGMVIVLLHKGAGPMTSIYRNGSYYLAIVGVMVVFGTVTSLLLSPKDGIGISSKKRSHGGV